MGILRQHSFPCTEQLRACPNRWTEEATELVLHMQAMGPPGDALGGTQWVEKTGPRGMRVCERA